MRPAWLLLAPAGCDGVLGLYPIELGGAGADDDGDAVRPPVCGWPTVASGPVAGEPADFDADDVMDVVTVGASANALSMLSGTTGGFANAKNVAVPATPRAVATANSVL